jgi:Zn-dependent peptidase ImmA (M78 family)
MMSNPKVTPTTWRIEQWAQQKAGQQADAIVRRLGLSAPIDPLTIANEEHPLLRAGGRDFADRFDGKLRYITERRCFVLMYNTKYDAACSPGTHHPRTRFSIAHELGHYFIDRHHAYLAHGGHSHASINEFRSKLNIEREADAFAASLLLPSHLVKPIINQAELSLARLDGIASDFETSLVSTAIRSVQLSHFPCALAGIRDGSVMWMFPSKSLIDAGIYPAKGSLLHNARKPWTEFQVGVATRSEGEGRVRDWFKTYERDELDQIYVTEEYIPVRTLGTLLVLLTMDESDVFTDEDPEYEDED